MQDSFYMENPQTSYNEYSNLYPAHKLTSNAIKAPVRRPNAENRVLTQMYRLDPFQKQMILDNERYRKQLMLQKDREEARRRRIIEQNTYSALGSTASTVGKYFIASLFQ